MKNTFNGNVFYKYTRQSLKANRTRTLVTIIGIVLSMALLTAVIEGAYSGISFIRRSVIEMEGAWMGEYYGLSEEVRDQVIADEKIAKTTGWQQIGWADIGGGNEYKPYLLIESVSEDLTDLVKVHLRDGRFPEKAGEILLPRHLSTNGGVEYKTGDELTLEVGRRVYADTGAEAGSRNWHDTQIKESIVDAQTRTYTVVGIYDRFSIYLEDFSCAGYTALTVNDEPVMAPAGSGADAADGQAAGAGSQSGEAADADNAGTDANEATGTGSTTGTPEYYDYMSGTYVEGLPGTMGEVNGGYRLFFTLKNPRSFLTFMDSEQYTMNEGVSLVANSDLISTYGLSSNSGINLTLFMMAAILVILIVFGSVTLIYNSFSISISERTKQFGILKSVGATKKQIRQTVLYEAFLLALIGIVIGAVVGCVGIGITLSSLSGSFARLFPEAGNVKMRLEFNIWAILIAAILCLITVLISAWIPALRAIRISAIESIRQSRDIQIKSRQVRTSRLTQKLFGFEGMMASKNFKRNRKRVRSVIISLFLSLVLFITASSFTSYLKKSIGAYSFKDQGYDIHVSGLGTNTDTDSIYEELSDLDGVKDVVYVVEDYKEVFVPNDMMAEGSFNEDGTVDSPFIMYADDNYSCLQLGLVFVKDDTFRELLKDNGIAEDGYFDPGAPKAIAFTAATVGIYNEEKGEVRYQEIHSIKPDIKSFTAPLYSAEQIIMVDGVEYMYSRTELDEEGTPHIYYMKLDSQMSAEDGSGGVTVSEFDIEMPFEKYGIRQDVVVAQTLGSSSEYYYIYSSGLALIYPYSALNAMYQPAEIPPATFYIKAPNHTLAAENIIKYLDSVGIDGNSAVYDLAESKESQRLLVTVVDVFAYGFIILISLIAVANVFNTISTNISLRRREFAMLKSIGLGNRGFYKMMNYECIIYGLRGLLWGLPISIVMTYLIFRAVGASVDMNFYIPWHSIVIAVLSVFVVVFAAMWYAAGKIRKDNPIDALKNENI